MLARLRLEEHVGAAEEAAAALEELVEAASKPTPRDTETLIPLSEEVVAAADELVEVGVLLELGVELEELEELEEELELSSEQKEINMPTLSV